MVNYERRKRERRSYINSIEIYSHESKKNVGRGFIMNWCEDGFGIISSQLLEIGRKFVIFFNIANGVEFDFLVEVVHARERLDSTAYGIRLLPGQSCNVNKLSRELSPA